MIWYRNECVFVTWGCIFTWDSSLERENAVACFVPNEFAPRKIYGWNLKIQQCLCLEKQLGFWSLRRSYPEARCIGWKASGTNGGIHEGCPTPYVVCGWIPQIPLHQWLYSVSGKWKPITVCNMVQRSGFRSGVKHYADCWSQWMAVQSGTIPGRPWGPDCEMECCHEWVVRWYDRAYISKWWL